MNVSLIKDLLSKTVILSGVVFMTSAMMASTAQANMAEEGWLSKERFQIRARAIGVIADGSGTVDGTNTQTSVDNAYVPEVDFTYFFTDNIAAELIVATSEHTVSAGGSALGDAWILPPTLTVQYHFQPDEKFSPYVGAGLNYSIFYGEDEAAGVSDFDIGNGVGVAVQAGFDYWLNDHWGLNVDVKYIDLNVDASISSGTVNASNVDINPFIVGVGASYRF